jgi:hypothetical protein
MIYQIKILVRADEKIIFVDKSATTLKIKKDVK